VIAGVALRLPIVTADELSVWIAGHCLFDFKFADFGDME